MSMINHGVSRRTSFLIRHSAMMKHRFDSDDDDDDDDSGRPSPLHQTQNFSKTAGSTFRKKTAEPSNMKLDFKQMNDDDDDSLNSSDEETNTKTGRSTSSGTASQLTPKPKERTFLKSTTPGKPSTKPRHIDIDDDDRNVFGQTTLKPSPRRPITTLREDEEDNQSFAKGFANERRRQSPTDLFGTNVKFDKRRSSRKSSDENDDSDRHSPVMRESSKSHRDSHRSKDGSDNDHDDFSNKLLNRQDFMKSKRPSQGSIQSPSREIDPIQPTSSGKDVDEQVKIPSRPSSAKNVTERQQTQAVIDQVSSVNHPTPIDPLTSNNETLAASLRPPSPPPRGTASLPPRPKQSASSMGPGHRSNRKKKFKVPSQYREITSKIDSGRTPVSSLDLTKSIERALEKALKSQPIQRPQSARARTQSAGSNDSQVRRRRLSSAYEHVQPRVNTNRSINFDELNTSQMRADSSRSITDAVYLEWAKTKEEEKKRQREEIRQMKEAKSKSIDKSSVEKQIYLQAQKLERWRQEKEAETRQKRKEEAQRKAQLEQEKKNDEQQKTKDALAGFDDWKTKKKETLKEKKDEEEQRKARLEKLQQEKQQRTLESTKKFDEWMKKKSELTEKQKEKNKGKQSEQMKKIQQEQESRFVTAQDAYEKWLKEKEKYENEGNTSRSRRNSTTAKPPVPFLPGGAHINTGKVRHVVW